MPSNEERRELAARLREKGNLRAFAEMVGFSWEDESDWLWHDVAVKYADLIEPEPERTCEGCRCEETDEWCCHECGGSLCGCMFKPSVDGFVQVPNYCPNCGAKVVGE